MIQVEDARLGADDEEVVSLRHLEQLVESAKARAHAQAFVNKVTGGADVADASASVSALGLRGRKTSAEAASELPLFDSLETFGRANPELLVQFPPAFETTPCKPLLFDIARNQLTPPDLGPRTAAQKTSYLRSASSYLFGSRS